MFRITISTGNYNSDLTIKTTPIDDAYSRVDYQFRENGRIRSGVIPQVHTMRISAWRIVGWAVSQQLASLHGSDPFASMAAVINGGDAS